MGTGKLIGLSTHSAEQVREAEQLQPDYIGFGPIFKPLSKKDHDPVVGLEGLRAVRRLTRLPIYAIGGIQREQVPSVLETGADGIAVISAVANAPDIEAAARELLALMAPRGGRAS
jgi:thiamine-phosphate pyrophosphorylase